MLVVMALVAVLVFMLTRAASGDPIAVLLGDQATAEDISRVQKIYGLDKPLPVQFGLWVNQLFRGNLGDSIFLQRPVTQALWERAEPTTLLALMAVAIATCIGVPCGVVSAVFRGRAIDQLFTGLAMLGASVPSFWFGLILMQLFAVGLGWFPVSGYGDPGASLLQAAPGSADAAAKMPPDRHNPTPETSPALPQTTASGSNQTRSWAHWHPAWPGQ